MPQSRHHNQPTCPAIDAVVSTSSLSPACLLEGDEGSPEELGGAGGVLREEELGAGRDELLAGEQVVLVGVDGLEGSGRHVGAEPDDLEEDAVLAAVDEAVVVGVNRVKEKWEGSADGVLQGGVILLFPHQLNEVTLGNAVFASLGQEVVPDSADLLLDDFAGGLVHLLGLHEALAHALEVLPRDRSVLIEVDPLEVGLHFAFPKLGHDCGGFVCALLKHNKD